MRKFKLSALIPQDKLGDAMAFMLERNIEVLECSILASPSADPGVARRPRKGTARSKPTEQLVFEQMPPWPNSIHRKEFRALLPQLTVNAIDGALSGLAAAGRVYRMAPGVYVLHEPSKDVAEPQPTFAERNPAENKF